MKEIILFVSSTFVDMIDERELLVRNIFPRIKRFCKEKGLIFRTIDLRWGITEEQANDLKQTVDICLKRVNDSVPLFLSFIGQRYGWVPSDAYLNMLQCDHPEEIERHKGCSVTELEIVQALHSTFYSGDKKHCLFFLKNPSYLNTIPDENIKSRYTEKDEESKKKLALLRQYLIDEHLDCSEYTSEFVPIEVPFYLEKYATPYSEKFLQTNFKSDGIALVDKIYDKLVAAIVEATAGTTEYVQCYQGERNQRYLLNQYHHSTPVFTIDAYLRSCLELPMGTIKGLYMPEMQGKSSSLARLIWEEQKTNPWVFYRFLGIDKNTDSIKSVLHTLAEEIATRQGKSIKEERNYVEDLTILQEGLNNLYEKGERSVLVIDGLDKTNESGAEWFDFFASLSFGHVLFSTLETGVVVNDGQITQYRDFELKPIIKYHFEQFGKSIADEYVEKLIRRADGKLVNIMHIVRYLVRFSTFESIAEDIDTLSCSRHLDAIARIDDEYSKLQPICIHWNKYHHVLMHMLSYTTYILMICRNGVTFDELSEMLFDIVTNLNGGMEKEILEECLAFELQLLSNELNEMDGVYSIKDAFYAAFLMCGFNRSLERRFTYFDLVVKYFCKFAVSKDGCSRHFSTVNEILENVGEEIIDQFLARYFCNAEYLRKMINIMGYSYFEKTLERYYVISLGWQHLLAPKAKARYELRRQLKKATMTMVQNQIGAMYVAVRSVPLGVRTNAEEAFGYIEHYIKHQRWDGRDDLKALYAFYNEMKTYSINEMKKKETHLSLEAPCDYKNGKTTMYLDTLYACGKDDRVYAYDLLSGEIDVVIQLEKDDRPLCLFYFEEKIFIVSAKYVYVWDVVHRIKNKYNYYKYIGAKVKNASTSRCGDVAIWHEDGNIKIYNKMQPVMEIKELMGKDIDYAWTTNANGRNVTVALVKEEGYYLLEEGKIKSIFGKDVEKEFLSEQFAGLDGAYFEKCDVFYYAKKRDSYKTIKLADFTEQEKELCIGNVLRIEYGHVITMSKDDTIMVNNRDTKQKIDTMFTYAEIVDGKLYIIDSERKLISFY